MDGTQSSWNLLEMSWQYLRLQVRLKSSSFVLQETEFHLINRSNQLVA